MFETTIDTSHEKVKLCNLIHSVERRRKGYQNGLFREGHRTETVEKAGSFATRKISPPTNNRLT
jgi:hypothetical protein